MPRYVYGSFCVRVGKGLFLNWMCCACMYALKVVGLKLNLFGHPVIAHLERLRSRCIHYDNFLSLWICGWLWVTSSVRMARSSAYGMVLYVVDNVLKWYPMLSFLAIGGGGLGI